MRRLHQSRAYRKAKSLVSATISSPSRLLELASSAQSKLTSGASKKLSEVLEPLGTSFRLINAYAKGHYRDVSIENLGLVVAAISYFLMPIDAVPDFIMALGLSDDAAILAWTFKKVADELRHFKKWEDQQADI